MNNLTKPLVMANILLLAPCAMATSSPESPRQVEASIQLLDSQHKELKSFEQVGQLQAPMEFVDEKRTRYTKSKTCDSKGKCEKRLDDLVTGVHMIMTPQFVRSDGLIQMLSDFDYRTLVVMREFNGIQLPETEHCHKGDAFPVESGKVFELGLCDGQVLRIRLKLR